MKTVTDAFRSARIDSVRHMEACDRAGLRWGEVAITEIVTSRAAPTVSVKQFNQRQEASSGADWIWWWVDANASYGMLVQAKRVTVSGGKWRFGFGYTGRDGRPQRSTLMSFARELGVSPVYGLYLGTADYRLREPCPDDHRGGRCLSCIKRSISAMPAILAGDKVHNSSSTYRRSVALEELSTPTPREKLPAAVGMAATLTPELRAFLIEPQRGVRAVARKMIDRVLDERLKGQFNAVSTHAPGDPLLSGEHDRLGSVFPELPDDTGHWGIPYFEQVLGPLHHAPPPYVLKLESSGSLDITDLPSTTMHGNVEGVVVVRLPQSA